MRSNDAILALDRRGANSVIVEPATRADLASIFGWLKSEYREDRGRGFWSNRKVIQRSLKSGDLFVIRDQGEAVAFQVGKYSAAIVNVRKDRQREGYGSALFKASLARALRDDVNVLSGECAPESSLPFWMKHEFERYGDLSEFGKITVRRVLHRRFIVPSELPRAEVTITFFPEAIEYRGTNPAPIAEYRISAARHDGKLLLDRRVIGLKDDEPEGHDLVVRIEVDGVERCFCKAKRDEARDAGVEEGREGDSFHIDVCAPSRTIVRPRLRRLQAHDCARVFSVFPWRFFARRKLCASKFLPLSSSARSP